MGSHVHSGFNVLPSPFFQPCSAVVYCFIRSLIVGKAMIHTVDTGDKLRLSLEGGSRKRSTFELDVNTSFSFTIEFSMMLRTLFGDASRAQPYIRQVKLSRSSTTSCFIDHSSPSCLLRTKVALMSEMSELTACNVQCWSQ